MTSKLKELMERAERWPEDVQAEAIASLEWIEGELITPYELTEADKQAIEQGLHAANEGRFATDAEVKAVFAKYRNA